MVIRKAKTKIGLVGCGAIGEGVALYIDKKLKKVASVVVLADKDQRKVKKLEKKLSSLPKICSIEDLVKRVDLVIEAASADAARIVIKAALKYKKDILILSVGALLGNDKTLRELKRSKINTYIPSGAICGVDGLGALSMGKIKKISLITSKPPKSLVGADYLKNKKLRLEKLNSEKIVFKGSVKDAIKYFPKNINVAATLLIASSFEDVRVFIKADPNLKRNIHRIRVEAKEAKVSIDVENIPSKLNPKTSSLAILSTQYLLKGIFSSFKIGS